MVTKSNPDSMQCPLHYVKIVTQLITETDKKILKIRNTLCNSYNNLEQWSVDYFTIPNFKLYYRELSGYIKKKCMVFEHRDMD